MSVRPWPNIVRPQQKFGMVCVVILPRSSFSNLWLESTMLLMSLYMYSFTKLSSLNVELIFIQIINYLKLH